ncbi:MAG: SDR family oxidoreductase [Solirubrobacterales bacterium]
MSHPAAADEPQAVLITGATGLVGHELMDQLGQRDKTVVMGVSRRGSPTDPEIVAWDMSSDSPPTQLRRTWDVIINSAANTRWTMGQEEATAANVSSVRALEQLASDRTRVIHVSTAYALGLRGDIESDDLSDYRNTYEWSKAHAERVAREAFADLTIVRPPLIVGRRSDGRAARFAGMYTLVRGLTLGTVPAVVADPDARFDAIPVDELGLLIADLAGGHGPANAPVLTIAAGTKAPTVEEALVTMVDSLNAWRRVNDRKPLESPPLITPDSWRRFFRPFVREHLTDRQLLILDLLQSFEPYLALSDPLQPDITVDDVLPSLLTATRYWAETNPRVARLEPQPWRGLKKDAVETTEASHA